MKLMRIMVILFLLNAPGDCFVAATTKELVKAAGMGWGKGYSVGWNAQGSSVGEGKVPILFLCWMRDGEEMGWSKWAWDEEGKAKETETIFSLVPKRAVFYAEFLKMMIF
jgi:hypothetical protein